MGNMHMAGLPAGGYPWAAPPRTGIVGADGLTGMPLPPLEELAGRTAVVAVGSNGAPEVFARKLAGRLDSGVPMSPATVEGIVIGHSAHVSARGYVPAAPAATQPGDAAATACTVAICWYDADQLAALDATEPNYRRVELPDRVPCRLPDAVRVPGAQIYDSVHGLLAEDGHVLPLLDQAGVLQWLADRLPRASSYGLGGGGQQMPDAQRAHDRLAEPPVREAVRLAILEAGLAVPSGLCARDQTAPARRSLPPDGCLHPPTMQSPLP